jgi:hypothetical protein
VDFEKPSNETEPQLKRKRNRMHENPNSGDLPPSQNDRVNAAWQQLNLVLSFFSRVDTKLSVVLGINLGMLAMLTARLPKADDFTLLIAVIGSIFAAPLIVSFWHIWHGYFPDLRGGTGSLIYFHPISKMTENDFRTACVSRNFQELEDDILNQCWRNSKILTCKFYSLRHAYVAAAVAIIPWMALIAALPPYAK